MSSAHEIVDVLDDDGNVVGTATRREIRARGLPHRCTYILVFDARGRLFVHQRTAAKDVFPSFWDVAVGGVLAAGEDWLPGAEREVREELGVVGSLEFLFDHVYRDKRNTAFGKVYRLRHDGPFALQPEEISRGEFIPIHEATAFLRDKEVCPDGLQIWRRYVADRPR
jgi:isopentenyldiphosphate isomerase